MPSYVLRAPAILLVFFSLLAFTACGSSHPTVCASASTSNGVCTCDPANSQSCPVQAPAYLYAVGTTGQVSVFPINLTTGAPGPPISISGPNMSLGLAAVNFSYLYVSNPQLPTSASSLDAWSININTGALTPITGLTLGPGSRPEGMAVDPAGPFLYVADVDSVDAFQVNQSSGALTPVSSSPFSSGTNLYLAIDPMDRFLFTADDDPEGGVFAFTINSSTGALTTVAGSPFPAVPGGTVNTRPFQLAVDSTGSFVYTALEATNQVAGFSISASSGALTAIPGSPFAAGNGPSALVTTGGFLYVSNATDFTVSGYSITPTTGVLTPLSGSPFAIPASALAINSTGGFLYASSPGGEMQVFSINSASGALTPISGSPFPGVTATALTYVQ